MNRKLQETAKFKKMGLVSIVVDGSHLDPPDDTLRIEIPVNREYFEKTFKFSSDLLAARKDGKTENG